MVTQGSQLDRVQSNRQSWIDLGKKSKTDSPGFSVVQIGPQGDGNEGTLKQNPKDSMVAYTFTNIQDTLAWLSRGTDPFLPGSSNEMVEGELPEFLRKADHVQVLCTGSLHLIGGILRLIDPDINDEH